MTTHDGIYVLEWLLDYRASGDIVPLRVEVTNWMVGPGEPWSADISVRYDGHPEVSAELIIHAVADGFRVEVYGKRVPPMKAARFRTFHAAQYAAERYALDVVHLIPVDA